MRGSNSRKANWIRIETVLPQNGLPFCGSERIDRLSVSGVRFLDMVQRLLLLDGG